MAWAGLHYGEEPSVSGEGGSGTLFFTGCTLACPFCQNYQISRGGMGREVAEDEFLSIIYRLKEEGAENLIKPLDPGLFQEKKYVRMNLDDPFRKKDYKHENSQPPIS